MERGNCLRGTPGCATVAPSRRCRQPLLRLAPPPSEVQNGICWKLEFPRIPGGITLVQPLNEKECWRDPPQDLWILADPTTPSLKHSATTCRIEEMQYYCLVSSVSSFFGVLLKHKKVKTSSFLDLDSPTRPGRSSRSGSACRKCLNTDRKDLGSTS